jgi:hypothetical protein
LAESVSIPAARCGAKKLRVVTLFRGCLRR